MAALSFVAMYVLMYAMVNTFDNVYANFHQRFAIRDQSAITERQFLKLMIPHHAAAIPMCEKAKLTDRNVRNLCERIIESQSAEIAEMKEKLAKIAG